MIVRRSAAVLAVVGALGCSLAVRPPPPGEPVKSTAEAIAVVARRESDTRTVTATFQFTIHRPDGTEEGSRGAVVVARPDRLRLQIFSFGVMTAYDYTVNGDRYRARRPLEGIDKTGRFGEAGGGAGADLAANGSEERQPLPDLRPLFLPPTTGRSTVVRDGGDRYVVAVGRRGARREIEVAKRDGLVSRETLFAGAEPRAVIRYDDYQPVDGVSLPFAIEVAYPEKSVRVSIRMTRYTRNQPIDPKLFEF